VTTLIMTAKFSDVDPLAWLADVLARIADLPQSRLAELLPCGGNRPASRRPPDCRCAVAQNPAAFTVGLRLSGKSRQSTARNHRHLARPLKAHRHRTGR